MLDSLILGLDKALRTLCAEPHASSRLPDCPDQTGALSPEERSLSAALMRVNHAGEVCAQALYHGQAITCRNPDIKRSLGIASAEEADHLAWTGQRIRELDGRKSLLNPFWYFGALSLGMLAGRMGDRWNMGFLAETELQVEAHLGRHLSMLPTCDCRSRAVIEKMKLEEHNHADMAVSLGALELPEVAKMAMAAASRFMTRTAYYI